jgi:hypothetical protein
LLRQTSLVIFRLGSLKVLLQLLHANTAQCMSEAKQRVLLQYAADHGMFQLRLRWRPGSLSK